MKGIHILFCTIFLITCVQINKVNSLNILGVFPYQGKSHFFVFENYLRELAKRGHNVTVISYFPQKENLKNYHDISLANKSKVFEDVLPLEKSYWNLFLTTYFILKTATENCKVMLEDQNVQNVWKGNVKFDVVVIEQFNGDCSLGLAHVLQAPVVGVASHDLMPWHFSRFGVPYNPAYVSLMFLNGGTKPTLYQRVERIVIKTFTSLLYKHISQREDQNTLSRYFEDIPPLEELGRNIKFHLIYTNFIHFGSRLFPQNVIEVGGYHIKETKTLPNDLRKFIEESQYGVIYISFGSMLKAATTPKDKVETIISALSELPQRVIWKWEEKSLPGNPKNIYLSKWLPQNDILSHPNVLAFYSHCGLLGTTEALHHGVPMLGMPIFGDQPGNAAVVKESGLGVLIELKELTKEKLLKKFKQILEPEFRAKVKLLSQAWRDRLTSAMDAAIHWTEFAARYPNFNFRSAAADVPTFQYLWLDVIFFLVVIPCIVALSLLLLLLNCTKKRKPVQTGLNFMFKKNVKSYRQYKSSPARERTTDITAIMHLYITILFTVIFNSANCLNILGIFPYQGKSHFFVYRVLLKELAERGHNVTVISHFPEKAPPKNYHDISLAGSIKIFEDDIPIHRSYWSILQIGVFLTTSGKENCEVMLANSDVQNMIKQKPKFDVVVLEQFNSDCALGIAYKLNSPVVAITSSMLMPWHYSRLGIPNNPSYVSFHFLEGGTKPTLVQRFERVVFDLYFRTLYYFVSQRSDQNTLARYFNDIPPLDVLARDIKFLLLYHNFILTGSQLFPANVIEVGGYHVKRAEPLTGDLKKFVEEAEHGIIYVSFGSVIKSTTLPPEKREAILEAVKELPQRFIWKWGDNTLLVDKNKLYLSDWLPQVDILGHHKTLAFISHAGMGGTTEAIHFGVPVVAMPVLGDQPANAAAIEESGLGVQLQIEDFTKENLIAALKKVLEPGFRNNVKLMSKAWHDRPMPPLNTAIYWTEFAARYSNFTFRSAAADVPWYQYTNLDIVLVFVTLLLLVLASSKAIISMCCIKKSKQIKKSKKRN
ncbi:uncharacterized protein [Battus philenor]|uniref:uncharacterized protein n=1 Tax=Battus philenor TaxID=42288 RepID=UPI0035D05F02